MVVIRESPRLRHSPSKPQVQWPPASPLEALLSSPSGRKRWQATQDSRRARSQSPSKINHLSASLEENEELEDEEALKLRLEILETKQKLQELAKKKRAPYDSLPRSTLSQGSSDILRSSSKRRKLEPAHDIVPQRAIEVPVSPSKALHGVQLPASPARARLGIENTRATDVSLKRPSNQVTRSASKAEAEKPISSFSQRLAQARNSSDKKVQKSERLDSIRSTKFGQMKREPPVISRTASSLQPSVSIPRSTVPRAKAKDMNSKDKAFYDPFSELHLESRQVSHTEVAQKLSGCEIYTIPRLLKEIKSPDYDPPDCESDYVVFGILAEKTSPFEQKQTNLVRDKSKDDTRMAKNKFMVLRLCDLKWQIDCYLFGTGFEQYWKLTEGTLIALLNPAIMPPAKNQHNGHFSLKITSSEDRILEIGTARDLGYCTAIKKNNSQCKTWVDKRKSHFCEFHVNLGIGQARKGRMEVNTMWRGKSPTRKPEPKKNPNVSYHAEYGEMWSTGGVHGRSAARLMDDDDTDRLHGFSKERAFQKRQAAAQNERELAKKLGDMSGGVAGDYFRAKYNLTQNTEGDHEPVFVKPTAAELGLLSRNADEQRLSPAKNRRRHFGIGAVSSAGTEALGWGGSRKPNLLPRPATPEKGQTKLGSILQSPTRGRSMSPKKNARFMLSKGIREPGRESGGVCNTKENNTNYDDDDDLDIV